MYSGVRVRAMVMVMIRVRVKVRVNAMQLGFVLGLRNHQGKGYG